MKYRQNDFERAPWLEYERVVAERDALAEQLEAVRAEYVAASDAVARYQRRCDVAVGLLDDIPFVSDYAAQITFEEFAERVQHALREPTP